jgi:hypothetical protein
MMELRCEAKLHGIVEDGQGTLEVKCDSRFCGHRPGVVVLHRFNLATGEVTTHRFANPPIPKEQHGSCEQRAAIRST